MTKSIAIAALLSVFAASSFAATPAASEPMAPASGAMMKKHTGKMHKMDKKADKSMSAASAASK